MFTVHCLTCSVTNCFRVFSTAVYTFFKIPRTFYLPSYLRIERLCVCHCHILLMSYCYTLKQAKHRILKAKVIWQKAAAQRTGGSDPKISPFLGGPGPPSNTMFLGTTGVSLPNGISFHPTVECDIQHTGRQTTVR